MCGRYVEPNEAALERFWTINRRNWRPFAQARSNIAPTLQVPIVIRAHDGAIEMIGARWGLIPWGWTGEDPPDNTFNARSETAAVKPMWRDAFQRTRCIMPIRGWYEWNENEPVKTAKGRTANQPYFHHCPDSPVIGVAGLWSIWEDPLGKAVYSCALLSKEACISVAHVHHRMPVILPVESYEAWLNPDTDADELQELIKATRVDFEVYRVSTGVNDARKDSPEMFERIPNSNVMPSDRVPGFDA